MAMAVTLASAGCAADAQDNPEGAVDSSEDDLLKKTGATSNWSYRGRMPALESPQLTVSLKGHTVHVAGLLPASFHGQLPFYAKTEAVGFRSSNTSAATATPTVASGAALRSTGPSRPARSRAPRIGLSFAAPSRTRAIACSASTSSSSPT